MALMYVHNYVCWYKFVDAFAYFSYVCRCIFAFAHFINVYTCTLFNLHVVRMGHCGVVYPITPDDSFCKDVQGWGIRTPPPPRVWGASSDPCVSRRCICALFIRCHFPIIGKPSQQQWKAPICILFMFRNRQVIIKLSETQTSKKEAHRK